MFDWNGFSCIPQPLVCPGEDLSFNDGGSVRTQLGQQRQRVLPHQLPNWKTKTPPRNYFWINFFNWLQVLAQTLSHKLAGEALRPKIASFFSWSKTCQLYVARARLGLFSEGGRGEGRLRLWMWLRIRLYIYLWLGTVCIISSVPLVHHYWLIDI